MSRRDLADEEAPEPVRWQPPPEDPAERAAALKLWQDYQACIVRVLAERKAGQGGQDE